MRQAERIIKDLDDTIGRTPAVQVALVNTNASDFLIKSAWIQTRKGTQMQTSGQEAPVTRKRSAEIDAERLEEVAAETAETDFGQRTALKRKAEGDPSDSEVEDSAMNWLAEVWHKENDPDGEVDLLILKQRDRCVASVHGRRNKPHYRSRLVAQECERQADWSFFTATPPLEVLRSLLICATIEELPNDVRQPVARTELVVLMLINVRRAHSYCAARRKVFVELPPEACTDKSKVGRFPRCVYGCRDAGVNWEFSICEVMIAIGFVQGRASPCIYHHLERQLRVWVHGDDFVPLGYIINVKWFFVKLQEVWGFHESRNPWAFRVPRLCAEHPSAGQGRGMDR